ncbi:MAG: ribonuclease HI [Halanaerobiaceae bacterium]
MQNEENENHKTRKKNEKITDIDIYTDGACTGNPGPGGFAAVIIQGQQENVICGYEPDTTNNRMELRAVLEALKHIETEKKVTIYSDSSYVINGITKWIKNWKKNNWKTSSDRLVKNKDLWKKLDSVISKYKIEFKKVKAHNGDKYNEKVDDLAREQIKKNL